METLPLWKYHILHCFVPAPNTPMRHILPDLRWNSFVRIQGNRRRTHEPALQYTIDKFNVLEWGCTPSAGKASGIAIAFRRKLFSFKNLVQIQTPPAELLGRVGAIRLKRGDVDFLVVNAYMPVNPHKARDGQN